MEKNLKVINLHGRTAFRKVLDEVCKNDDEGLLTDCVILARRKPKNGEGEGQLIRYWFGEKSTTNCLGMVTHMQFVISNYIEGIDYCAK